MSSSSEDIERQKKKNLLLSYYGQQQAQQSGALGGSSANSSSSSQVGDGSSLKQSSISPTSMSRSPLDLNSTQFEPEKFISVVIKVYKLRI